VHLARRNEGKSFSTSPSLQIVLMAFHPSARRAWRAMLMLDTAAAARTSAKRHVLEARSVAPRAAGFARPFVHRVKSSCSFP
jgi:hypothetical protein